MPAGQCVHAVVDIGRGHHAGGRRRHGKDLFVEMHRETVNPRAQDQLPLVVQLHRVGEIAAFGVGGGVDIHPLIGERSGLKVWFSLGLSSVLVSPVLVKYLGIGGFRSHIRRPHPDHAGYRRWRIWPCRSTWFWNCVSVLRKVKALSATPAELSGVDVVTFAARLGLPAVSLRP